MAGGALTMRRLRAFIAGAAAFAAVPITLVKEKSRIDDNAEVRAVLAFQR